MSEDRITAHARAYERCLAQAAADAGGLMRRAVAACAQLMAHNAATHGGARSAEALREAARALLRQGDAIAAAFEDRLLESFGAAAPASAQESDAQLATAQQAAWAVEIARLADAVQARAQAELVEFAALVSAAQGLHLVLPQRNPLAPSVYARCVHAAAQAVPAAARHRAAWLRFLGEALGRELAVAYAVASAQLRAHGVREAGFMAKPSGRGPVESWAPDAHGHPAHSRLIQMR